MSNTTIIRIKDDAATRASILKSITRQRQAIFSDLCREFSLSDYAMMLHLRELKNARLAHRIIPMTTRDAEVGQVWTTGPVMQRDDADAEPIQIFTHNRPRPSFRISALEAFFFPSYGVAA